MDALGAEAVELVPSGAGDEAEVPVLVARASSLHTSPRIDIKKEEREKQIWPLGHVNAIMSQRGASSLSFLVAI